MSPSRRFDVGSRVLAAVIGGYVATGLMAAALARVLPLSKPEATHAATLVSFVFYVAIVIAVFHARTSLRSWAVVAAVASAAGIALLAGAAP